MPMRMGDWYCKGTTGGQITPVEKHSGMQSHQLGSVLFSIIEVTPASKGYIFTGWIKNVEPNQEVAVCIQRDLNGPSLVEQVIGNTGGDWKKFECVLPDARSATQLIAYIHPRNVARTPQAVYVDDISFGPLIEEEEYQYSPNGRVVRGDGLDEVKYDPLTALPLEIRKGNQSSHFWYGARRQRVLKAITTAGQNTKQEQRLYMHGVNAYPLAEKTNSGESTYIYGPGGLVALREDEKTISFFLKDHLGSTRMVVSQENQPIAAFNYLPFGDLIPGNSSQQDATRRFRYLYTSQEYDGETGLYNYRARIMTRNLGGSCRRTRCRNFSARIFTWETTALTWWTRRV